MNIIRSFKSLTRCERCIWFGSLTLITVSALAVGRTDPLTVIASLLGATALIFVGAGDALGQLLTIFFSLLYAIISFKLRYYGEMITYMGMTAPAAFCAMVTWLRHPYAECEVKVAPMTRKRWFWLFASSIAATAFFGVLLARWGTANLFFSVISVTTSWLASILTIFRSPFYAAAYSANDVILIILWVLASMQDTGYIPMVICFVVFLVNDMYGLINWSIMERHQDCRCKYKKEGAAS